MADDSPVARTALARRIAKEGFRVVEGDSAALSASVDPTSLAFAIIDLDLGDGDGTQLATSLRRASPGLPLAFFTAGALPAIVARARVMGRVFSKPGDLDLALEWIVLHAR